LQYTVEPLSSLHNCTGRRLLPFLSRERHWIRCVAGELVAAERDAKVGQIGNFQIALVASAKGFSVMPSTVPERDIDAADGVGRYPRAPSEAVLMHFSGATRLQRVLALIEQASARN
jgi:hypothetical protein